jgi:hypothetical protein
MEIIKEIKLGVNFKEPFFYKNCSLKFLEKKFDKELVLKIKDITESNLPNPKAFITYDIGYQVFEEGTKSCVNTGWHIDGVGNDYLMYAVGDFRTIFSQTDFGCLPDSRDKLLEFNNSIEKLILAGEEIPNATLIRYTSKDIHKGRVATSAGARFFLRVCSSDYLRPSNKLLSTP